VAPKVDPAAAVERRVERCEGNGGNYPSTTGNPSGGGWGKSPLKWAKRHAVTSSSTWRPSTIVVERISCWATRHRPLSNRALSNRRAHGP